MGLAMVFHILLGVVDFYCSFVYLGLDMFSYQT